MDPDSSLPRSSRSTISISFAFPLIFSILILLISFLQPGVTNAFPGVTTPAAESTAYLSPTNTVSATATLPSTGLSEQPYEEVSFAYPYPLTTVVVVLLFIGMLLWLFYRSRSEGGRKTHIRRWAR